MFRWEPEGKYCCTKSVAKTPFWFSMEHHSTASVPFWFSMEHHRTVLVPFWFSAHDIQDRVKNYFLFEKFEWFSSQTNFLWMIHFKYNYLSTANILSHWKETLIFSLHVAIKKICPFWCKDIQLHFGIKWRTCPLVLTQDHFFKCIF